MNTNPTTAAAPAGSLDVLMQVQDERERQDAKWGEQNHPNGTGPAVRLFGFEASHRFRAMRDRAITTTNVRAEEGKLTYGDIFLEEVFEAMAEEDPQKLRAELIQCAAVAVAWVEKIDRAEASK